MKTLVTQYKENVVGSGIFQKLGSLYIEATNGPFTDSIIVVPVAANPKVLYGQVTFTYQWTNPTHKALVINSIGAAKVEIENYYGASYIKLAPYSTVFKFDNIAGLGIIKAFDSSRIDQFDIYQCAMEGDIALAGAQPNMKGLYIQDKSGALFGEISSLGDNIGMLSVNLYGNINVIGDENALFDSLAANGKTTSMGFDFRNSGIYSSSGEPLNGTVVFSNNSWSIQ